MMYCHPTFSNIVVAALQLAVWCFLFAASACSFVVVSSVICGRFSDGLTEYYRIVRYGMMRWMF